MKYVPCADSGFMRKSYYCYYDRNCFIETRVSQAEWARTIDTRNGQECSNKVISCIC